MAIIDNTASAIGDILKIEVQLAVRGDIELTSFSDSIIGETANRFFEKRFRYSFDKLNWTDIKDLSTPAIQSITGKVPGLLFFEFYYERKGNDDTGVLEFESIEILGDIVVQICINTVTVESIFAELSNNEQITTEVANNLLRKIYYSGILPEFIERGEGINDKDFIAFWSAVCLFMSFLISFASTFDEILYRRNYLIESLRQRGLVICGEETILDDLQYLANNFKDEIRKRGTSFIVKEKGDQDTKGGQTSVRGEFLRILCKNHYDEFLFELMKKEHMGYCVGQSSLLYNGTNNSTQLNKTGANYDLLNTTELNSFNILGNCSIDANTPEERGEVLIDGINSGIGYSDSEKVIDKKISELITVDSDIDYEITFKLKIKGQSKTGIKFGVNGYNRNGVYKPLSFQNCIDGTSTENFLDGEDIIKIARVENVEYFFRGIIYAAGSTSVDAETGKLNIGFGNNLRFRFKEDVEKIKIFIQTDEESGTQFFINSIQMRPLIRGKNILKSNLTRLQDPPFIKNPHFIQKGLTIMTWIKNNNEDYTDLELINFMEKYLIPYQHKIVPIFLSPNVDDKQLLT